MGLLKKSRSFGSASVQTARGREKAYSELMRFDALPAGEWRLYRSLREAVPAIDAAIGKLVRLCGTVRVGAGDPEAERELSDFLARVPVGATGEGLSAFLSSHLEQLLTYGTAVGEIVLSSDGVAALYSASLEDVVLEEGDSPLRLCICRRSGLKTVPVPHPERVIVSALNPEPGHIYGTSLLRGLPFVSGILLKIYRATGVNFDRMGNVRFAVTYKPPGDGLDRGTAKERARQIAQEWSSAMSSDSVRDFVAVGDVDIKVIGADNQILDTEVPARQMMEQIVGKLGIPPFLLGLSWSTTERMSAQQADILTSELEYYRALLSPAVRKICRMWLAANGYACEPQVEWEPVNLQDEVEEAKARLYRAQAEQLEKEGKKN